MTTEIRIEPKSAELIRGKTVRVPIIFELEERLKLRGLRAMFHGAEETKATYTTYNAATKSTQVHTAVQHIDIVKREFLLAGNERLGFFGNVADGLATLFGGGEHDVLEPGKYPFEVELDVPADAQGTFESKMCRIFYELSVRADVPLAFDVKAKHSFTVARQFDTPASSMVRTRYPEDQGRGLLDAWFGPDLRVEAGLAENVFRSGDMIEGVFRVDTPEPLECRSITGSLVGIERTQAHGHNDTATHHGTPSVVATPGMIDRSFKQDFRIPALFDGPVSRQGELFSVDWYVQIQLDVPWAKDPKIRVPVTLLPC